MPSNAMELQKQPAGITESCKYNDHSQCNGAGGRCGCDCHKPASIAQQAAVAVQIADPLLTKACPVCNIKRPQFERFCRMCGSKLGSVQCPACNCIADPEDKYCYSCGMPMKGTTQDAGAAAGNGDAGISNSVGTGRHEVETNVAEINVAEAERNVLTALLSAQAAQAAHSTPAAAASAANGDTDERTFTLPQGTFKISGKRVAAGKIRDRGPFKP